MKPNIYKYTMKKFIIISTLLALISSYSHAQTTTAGAGLAFGTDVSQLGFTINGQYFFSDALAAAPNFIFYLPEKVTTPSGTSKGSLWEFNADVNYYFYDEAVKLYGIGGINVSFGTTKFDSNTPVLRDFKTTDTDAGLNLGIGSDFKTKSNIVPFFLMKFTISSYQQLVLAGGVRIPF